MIWYSPPFLHTASDQKLEVYKAWKWCYEAMHRHPGRSK